MVTIKNKNTGKIIAKGKVVNETSVQIRIHNSKKWYKKKEYIIQKIMFLLIVLVIISCKSKQQFTAKQKQAIKKTDSIAMSEKFMLEIDFRENN